MGSSPNVSALELLTRCRAHAAADGGPSVCPLFLQLLEVVPVGAVVVDLDDRVVIASPAFSRLFGYPADWLPGRELAALLVPESRRGEPSLLRRRAFEGAGGVPLRTVRRRRDGSLVEVDVQETVLRVGGEAIARLQIYQDRSGPAPAPGPAEPVFATVDQAAPAAPGVAGGETLAAVHAALESGEGTEARLHRLARALVPGLADSCIIYLLEPPDGVRRAAIAFADPAQEELLREQLLNYPPRLDRLIPPVARALRTGEPQLIPEVSIGSLKAVPGDQDHVSVALLVGLSSLLVVPIVVAGRVRGAIGLATAESGRRLHQDDVPRAEAVAHLASRIF